jgi:hypothetical protein
MDSVNWWKLILGAEPVLQCSTLRNRIYSRHYSQLRSHNVKFFATLLKLYLHIFSWLINFIFTKRITNKLRTNEKLSGRSFISHFVLRKGSTFCHSICQAYNHHATTMLLCSLLFFHFSYLQIDSILDDRCTKSS